jgi:hypothetical protein
MTRRVEVRTGLTGYRCQLDRVRRFYDRVTQRPEGAAYLIDYQDDVQSFFMHCWHLKDWVKHDPLIDQPVKDRIKDAVHASDVLKVANDLATSAKHLEVNKSRAGAELSLMRLDASGELSLLDCIIEVNGAERSAREVAAECLQEWERILMAEGLPVERMGT